MGLPLLRLRACNDADVEKGDVVVDAGVTRGYRSAFWLRANGARKLEVFKGRKDDLKVEPFIVDASFVQLGVGW